MTVLKFMTLEDAEKTLWNFSPDTAYYKMVFSLNNIMFKKIILKDFPRGVHKYKTLFEAQRDMENWLLKRI